MIKPKISECLYCKRVSIWSTHFKNYVCDDCYAKGLGGDKLEGKERYYTKHNDE